MKLVVLFCLMLFFYSCAPVKFSRSNDLTVDPNVNPNTSSVLCSPKINDTVDTFTYSSSGSLPFITSSCNTKDLTYTWVVKKADATVVSATIPGLEPVADPKEIDFRGLGSGAYYVFLEARSATESIVPYIATTPLEFIVPGGNMGNNLVCDPKLNQSFTSLSINTADANPEVRANCNPLAAMYIWSVQKTGQVNPVVVPGLSTEVQTPDFKSLGQGEYKMTLFATTPNSGAWRSSSPLVVNVIGSPTPTPKVECTPRINGSLTKITLTGMSPKPLITANCNPADVQYAWTVRKGGQTVSDTGLSGANSNPDFVAKGNGTYIIHLTASKSGMQSWSTTIPLEVTVDNNGPNGLAIQCAPRLNGQSVAMTILTSGPNPVVTSGCQPAGVTHQWVVTRGGQNVTVAGLSGATSTPQFAQLGQGTYLIFLTATASGYNSYVSPSPLEVTVAPVVLPTRKVLYSKMVEYGQNKVDILMVVDDSNSMAPDNLKLAQQMNEFVTELSTIGIDWQICTTVTRYKMYDGEPVWGLSLNWTGLTMDPKWVLKPTASDTNAKFVQTIQTIGAGWQNSDDERGIKAAYHHVGYSKYPDTESPSGFKDYSFCNRPDASLSVIIISDEDERSIGGDNNFTHNLGEFKPLDPEDLPQNYINQVKQTLGADKRFAVNSIIVKPGDAACMAQQDAPVNGEPQAKSHYGYKYAELSNATGGNVGSICDSDYKANLNLFKTLIISSLASVPLECAPVGEVKATITPSAGNPTAKVEANPNRLVFSPAIEAGRKIDLEYYCPMN